MNIFTSIPKAHANGMDYIKKCVDSWKVHGKVYSVNHPNEIDAIKDLFPDVEFVKTFQTQKALFQKPLVSIDTILNEMRKLHDGKSMFINSDCHLTDNIKLLDEQFQINRFTYLHRWNYNNDDTSSAMIYENGIDAFLFTNMEILEYVQQTHFCIGQTYFDLYYPFAIGMAGMELCTNKKNPILFHKNHAEQYSAGNWNYMGDYCSLIMAKKSYKPAQITQFLYSFIRTTTVKL